jgi:hypothetical protein
MRFYKTVPGYGNIGIGWGKTGRWLCLGRIVFTTEVPDGDRWDWASELGLTPRQRTLVARAIYHATGWAWAHLRYPQRLRRVTGHDPVTLKPSYGSSQWAWLGPAWALRYGLDWAGQADPGHFDHWALDHKGCPGPQEQCPSCGGTVCYHPHDDDSFIWAPEDGNASRA